MAESFDRHLDDDATAQAVVDQLEDEKDSLVNQLDEARDVLARLVGAVDDLLHRGMSVTHLTEVEDRLGAALRYQQQNPRPVM